MKPPWHDTVVLELLAGYGGFILLGLAIFLLLGCATTPQTDAYHIQPAVLVITTDTELIERACITAKRYADGAIVGCYVPTMHPPAIYCPPNDAAVCWHELYDHHVRGMQH